ncbi:glycosyltransferase family 2 protein [Mucilaginibacter myungsuensis]|uniref:Glycosyltransferase family 2 protein n=1 Tax=Mucilaginibacter myungsuensis TaxID=649104 RepID=A0A929PUP1_9SPHI|nr:glycosyltransferase family 2 protein [Mucilaginibacter myungsuensis]MBE9660319.1 glycosyltransferase family 2 protein [Mucilaginibacter myungsuensis]MDN3600361.1 glycosyltransferase family 2 protein [Mucilaginibacter myungsuensis]
MSNLPKVAVVILNWNGLKHLSQFLPSVLASEWDNLDIVVGDNASSDGSVSFLQHTFPTVSIIQNDQNYGFTGGYNRVLEQVEADYLILLNSDIEVTPNWIKPVIDMMEADELIAAAAPKIKSYHQQTHFEHAGAAGGFIDSYGYPFCRGRIFYEVEEDKGQYDTSGEVFWASGAAMFIKKKCWDLAGGFDERFFAHMEEIDLCWRLKNLDYKIMYCAESEVFHVGGGTLDKENPFKTYLNFRNNLLLLKKNLSFGRAFYTISLRIWLDFLAVIRFMNEGKRKDAWAVSRAHQNFFRTLFNRPAFKVTKAHHTTLKCMYKRNIVWDFFIKKKKAFSDLSSEDFFR